MAYDDDDKIMPFCANVFWGKNRTNIKSVYIGLCTKQTTHSRNYISYPTKR